MKRDIRQKKEKKVEQPKMTCLKCQVAMEMKQKGFSYLGRVFHTDILTCPVCGQVYVSEDLAKGRMNEVETLMEDK